MSIGVRIKELRIEKDAKQSVVAKAIGYSDSILSEWERGMKQPTASAIIELSRYFAVSTDYLLGLNDDDNPVIHMPPKHNKREIDEIVKLCNDLDKIQLSQVKGFIFGISKASSKNREC